MLGDPPAHKSAGLQNQPCFLSPAPLAPSCCPRGAGSTASGSQQGQQAGDLTARVPSPPAQGLHCRALEKSAREIPGYSFQGKTQNKCIQRPRAYSDMHHNQYAEYMCHMLITKIFVLHFHNQNIQWTVVKWFSRAFCFRLVSIERRADRALHFLWFQGYRCTGGGSLPEPRRKLYNTGHISVSLASIQ